MIKGRLRKKSPKIISAEMKRRRREVIIICAVILIIVALTYIENRVINLDDNFPISNTILMFILININILLLILLIFLVIRNLVKLLYERRRKVMGARLRTRLVLAFIGLTLLPTSILFFFSITFIANSIEFWFEIPVEHALENSLRVGRQVYVLIHDQHKFYLERIAYQVHARKLMDLRRRRDLDNYIQVVQREFNIQSVEVYDGIRRGNPAVRISMAVDSRLYIDDFAPVDSEYFKQFSDTESVWRISESIKAGELVRFVGTVPFGEDSKRAEAFIVLSVLLSPALIENMDSISQGIEDYKQKKMLKEPIRLTYYLAMLIVALLLIFCAIWFGFRLAKALTIPINQLALGTRRVAEGDLEFSIGPVGDDEIGSLVESFNKMTHDLKLSRQQLEASAVKLKEQNTEIESRRRYMEIVLDNVSTGVITLNADGLVITINRSAETMLNICADTVLSKPYAEILEDQTFNIADEIMKHLVESSESMVEFPLKATIAGAPKSFILRVNRLLDDTGRSVGLVMVFDDLTELEKAQRMAAWREVARRIAHEVKNPLTPIKLSAQRLKRKYSKKLNEPVFEECTQMIIDHVDLIRNLVNEFSAYARFPEANPRPCETAPIIEETIALFKEGHRHIHFEMKLPEEKIILNLDRHQLKQALINLVTNAIAAIKGPNGWIQISLSRDPAANLVRIEVADNGSGINDEEKSNLFQPYFSTKTKGMGLGLSIVSSIISAHHGTVSVQDNVPQGAKFIIELPEVNRMFPVRYK